MESNTENIFPEGEVTKKIEHQTARLPSDTFLWAAFATMSTAFFLQCMGKKHTGLFVGQWAAPLLLFGIYNKIVKTHGSDNSEEVEESYLSY
ncbi:hypothetical protein ACE38W_15375 [Chitinophaga sp. Hz27]|uniref:hypothetical protein n=1 Tax=Chitinophaga sp. Hz27 TaxID=3347169 RepID=UPI0035E2A3A3